MWYNSKILVGPSWVVYLVLSYKVSDITVHRHTTPEEFEDAALCLLLGLPSAYESGAFQERSLRTFALIVSAHPYCARKFACHVMHERARLVIK